MRTAIVPVLHALCKIEFSTLAAMCAADLSPAQSGTHSSRKALIHLHLSASTTPWASVHFGNAARAMCAARYLGRD